MTALDRLARLEEIRAEHDQYPDRDWHDHIGWLLEQVKLLELRLEQWGMAYGPSALPNASRILREHEQYRAALRRIAEHEPAFEIPDLDNGDCNECYDRRKRNWPPSRLCPDHFRALSEVQQRNESARANQGWELRRIARIALEGEVSDGHA